MAGDPVDLELQYNFERRVRDERAVYAAADALIATTPQQRDILVNGAYGVPHAKVAVVPPGFDDTRFYPVAPATRQALKREAGFPGPLVLALGRVAANKGYDLLLRSMPTVLSRVPAVTLLLAIGSTEPTPGEQRQVADLQQLAADLGIVDRVRFRDHIPDEHLADTYRAADVFALSSRYEPFGMTAVEAMACGTPVVMTTEGGLWEMVAWGLEALYASPLDPEAFGHALATVLLYPRVAEQLARFGSHRARATFTWNGIAQQLIGLPQLRQVSDGDAAGVVLSAPRHAGDRGTEATLRALEWVPATSS